MSDTAPRTRQCTMCAGKGGATQEGTETRDGRQVTTSSWRQCSSCNGTGQVPV